MSNNIDLEKLIFNALKESLRDFYYQHKHGMMLMEFNSFTDKEILELIPISLFSLNLEETCFFIVKNLNEIVIKNFDGTIPNCVELKKIIFNSSKKALKDLYLKHGDGGMLSKIDNFTYRETEENICCCFDQVDFKEIITSMANYLNENFEIEEKKCL
jgi:hypothetical protein